MEKFIQLVRSYIAVTHNQSPAYSNAYLAINYTSKIRCIKILYERSLFFSCCTYKRKEPALSMVYYERLLNFLCLALLTANIFFLYWYFSIS